MRRKAGAATFHRLRVLDLVYTYLEGGDVADVTAVVRTLSYEPIQVRVLPAYNYIYICIYVCISGFTTLERT